MPQLFHCSILYINKFLTVFIKMDDLIKAIISSSDVSFRSASSFLNVIDSADYSDNFSKYMSDTPNLDGYLDENSARAMVHFAHKNLR